MARNEVAEKIEVTEVPAIGSPFAGGFFAGEMVLADGRYALIVAGKQAGEKLDQQYKTKGFNAADGTDSDDDGMANSDRISDAKHPAAQFCRSLEIEGYDDWYLPSRDELMRIWMALGPNRKTTPFPFSNGSPEAFEGRYYWSSTEHASYSDYAWIVYFDNGYQSFNLKNDYFGVRAVRRLKI